MFFAELNCEMLGSFKKVAVGKQLLFGSPVVDCKGTRSEVYVQESVFSGDTVPLADSSIKIVARAEIEGLWLDFLYFFNKML